MSVHAYSEPYTYDRRYIRAFIRNTKIHKDNASIHQLKSAEIIHLQPREITLNKPIELGHSKFRRLGAPLFTAIVVGLHLLVFGYIYYQPIAEAVKNIEPHKIKLERYTPPVIPPQAVEQPKIKKKDEPKPIPKKVITDNPNVIEEYVAPQPVTTETAQAPEKVTEASATAAYLNNPSPTYPEVAQEKGWEGTVVLNVLVQADGKAGTVEIKTSSGKKILDQAAAQTVQRWVFVPARRGETAIEGWVEVPIDFRLGS